MFAALGSVGLTLDANVFAVECEVVDGRGGQSTTVDR
jgi:hypothetical protein